MSTEEKEYKNENERKGIPYKKIKGIDTLNGLFPDYYIDNEGCIWDLYGNEIPFYCDSRGYLSVTLKKSHDHKSKKFMVHRLVAFNFLPRELIREQVDHLNCNKDDNCEGNLEWVTNDENMRRATANGLRPRGAASGNNKYPEELMKGVIYDLYIMKLKVSEIVKKYDIHEHTVRSVRDREYWNWLIDEVLAEHGCEGTELTHRKRHTKELMTKVVEAIFFERLDNIKIARKYNLPVSTVNNVKCGRSWGWLVKEIAAKYLVENKVLDKRWVKRKQKEQEKSELERSTTREVAP